MFDLGVYNVTTLTGLLGPVKRVMAMSGIAIPERVIDGHRVPVKTDDNAQLLLDFGDTCYAVITTGFTIQRYNVPGIELYGTQGTIQMIGEDWAPRGYELWQNSEGCWRVYEAKGAWPWTDGIRHMIECIEQGTPPVITPEHAYHVLEIMLKSMESGRNGQALPIESTFTPPRFEAATDLGQAAHLEHDPGRAS
jgi:predicted dehydrogenase